jgi:hypothetical protein
MASLESPFGPGNGAPPESVTISICVNTSTGRVEIGTQRGCDPVGIVNALLVAIHFMMPILAKYREVKISHILKEVSTSILDHKDR